MICPNCKAEISDGQLYCGQCGSPGQARTVEDIQNQIESIRGRLDEIAKAKTVEQRFLELDTCARVADRLWGWGKIVGFLLLLPLVAFGLLVGKEFKDLRDIPEATREAIKPVLEAARSEAESAKATAASALQTSQEVRSVAEDAKQQLSELKKEITKGVAQVRSLDGEVQKSKAQLQALDAALKTQSKRVDAVAQQMKKVSTEKNTQRIREAYPAAFGERIAMSRSGPFDSSVKATHDLYVSLVLLFCPPRNANWMRQRLDKS